MNTKILFLAGCMAITSNSANSQETVYPLEALSQSDEKALELKSSQGKAIWVNRYQNNVGGGGQVEPAKSEPVEIYISFSSTSSKYPIRVCFTGGSNQRVRVVVNQSRSITLFKHGCTDVSEGAEVIEIVNRDNKLLSYGTWQHLLDY